ncbi:hypothetical protein, partial [Massilia genomosp. 1]|uniref:hypothetical protein n=1 Tax=Massilia genomosp. 1 TaxID=2609280 RepID=UPI001C9E6C17
ANGSKPTLAVFNSYGGTVGTDFGPAVAVTYVKGNTGENFAGDARTVSAGATILRGSAEGGIVFDKQNNRVGYTAGLGLKAPLP